MKSPFVTLALIATSLLAVAQSQVRAQAQPVRIAKAPSEPLPQAQDLLDNLFAPYEAAKTFRGTFDIAVKGERNAIAEIHLDALFRYHDKGVLDRQNATMKVVGRAKPTQRQTFVFVDENGSQKVVLVEQKAWWIPGEREDAAAPFLVVKPLLDQVVQALEVNDDFVPVVTRGVDAGRSVFILKAKKSNILRVVIDEQTRAIRSLVVKDNISIDGTNQVFNEPITDQELTWIMPADFRQVAEGEVAPPASLGITVPGLAATPTG